MSFFLFCSKKFWFPLVIPMSASPHVRTIKKSFSRSEVFKIETFKRIVATQPHNKTQANAYNSQFHETPRRKKSSFHENVENWQRNCDEDARNEEISREILEKFVLAQRNLIRKVVFLWNSSHVSPGRTNAKRLLISFACFLLRKSIAISLTMRRNSVSYSWKLSSKSPKIPCVPKRKTWGKCKSSLKFSKIPSGNW